VRGGLGVSQQEPLDLGVVEELRAGRESLEPGRVAVMGRDQARMAQPAAGVGQNARDDLGNGIEAEGGELRLDRGAREPGSRVLGQRVQPGLEEPARRGSDRVVLDVSLRLLFRRLFCRRLFCRRLLFERGIQ